MLTNWLSPNYFGLVVWTTTLCSLSSPRTITTPKPVMTNLNLCLCFLLSTLSVRRILLTLVGFYSSALFPPPIPVSLCLDAVSTFVSFLFSSCSALTGLFLQRTYCDGSPTRVYALHITISLLLTSCHPLHHTHYLSNVLCCYAPATTGP